MNAAISGRGHGSGRRRLAAAVGSALGLGLAAARAAVSLTLHVPEAETWVLGDPIPLNWRFRNDSKQPLGFMWEGCCRLNGRLEVARVDRGVPEDLGTVPPGQALAHMFAKADRLEPDLAKDYDTRVGDWVALPGTGRYRLRGTYRGVLPTQFPQIPRGLALWRDEATSPPVEVAVLGVGDYLGQRTDRERRRGWTVALSGPARWSPLAPNRFSVRLENRRSEAGSVRWPESFALWVVDGEGRRKAPAAIVSGAAIEKDVGPGQTVEFEFAVAPDRIEGEGLGRYSVFVDWAGSSSREPRLPSNVLSLEWRLGREEVEALVREASRGSASGARNAPLKLLRVYLADVGGELERLGREDPDPAARGLAGRLALASRLKPLAPQPGDVGIPVAVDASGRLAWADARWERILGPGTGGLRDRARDILNVRRHLGWDVVFVLQPAPEATLGVLADVAAGWAPEAAFGPVTSELRPSVGGTNAPARWTLRSAADPGVDVAPAEAVAGDEIRSAGDGASTTVRRHVTWDQLRRRLEGTLRPGERREIRIVP